MVGRDATDEITVYVEKSPTNSKTAQLIPVYTHVVVDPSSQFRESHINLTSLLGSLPPTRSCIHKIKLTRLRYF
jgi:hypothetical protein